MIFWRIFNNQLHPIGDVENLGFEKSEGLRIPDEYLDNQKFVVMRTAHGLGDWAIISAMPRLLKQKYPNCKVYVPSIIALEKLFGNIKQNWGSWDNPFKVVNYIFDNNPYVDEFVDDLTDEVFHDHYRIYDKNKLDIPLVKQMLRFWQFKDNEMKDYVPEIYWTEEEKKRGDEIIKKFVGEGEFGGLMITNRFDGVSPSTGETYDVDSNTKIIKSFLDKFKDLPFFYYTHKKPSEYPFSFNKCLDMRHMNMRLQLYIRSKAKLNIGTHCGIVDAVTRYSPSFQIERYHPNPKHNVLETNHYLNKNNYLEKRDIIQ